VTRAILHVDMDAFYASVEQLDDPKLRGKPVLVGGAMRRGVVAAASYEARVFGAKSAMPMAEALRKCPQAIVVPPRMRRYSEVSAQVFAIFQRYTPLVEGLSLDEAFLDVTGSQSLFGDGPAIARKIKDDIRRELSLTASAGVAPCKFAAKIASDLQKPDGLVVVPDDVATFLAPLPIERMWGIGPKTAPKVRAAGYGTIGDLARAQPRTLERLMGTWGLAIRALANGEDTRDVSPDGVAQSIGAEETFDDDLTTRSEIEHHLLAQSERVAQRLVATEQVGRGIAVKLKWADFTVRSRRTTLPEGVCDTPTIHEAACALLDRFELVGARIRLTGVSVFDLGPAAGNPTLFPDEEHEKRTKLEHLVKDLRGKFGKGAIGRAALTPAGGAKAGRRDDGE
jgi:DNA polymerase-4